MCVPRQLPINIRSQDGISPLHTPIVSAWSSSMQVLLLFPTKAYPGMQEKVATVPRSKLGEVSVAYVTFPLLIELNSGHCITVNILEYMMLLICYAKSYLHKLVHFHSTLQQCLVDHHPYRFLKLSQSVHSQHCTCRWL